MVERLELGSGFETFGVDFWTKNQWIKVAVTDGEEFTYNGQGFRNNQKIRSVAKKTWHFSVSEDENVTLCKSSLVTMCINLGEASMELPREPGTMG